MRPPVPLMSSVPELSHTLLAPKLSGPVTAVAAVVENTPVVLRLPALALNWPWTLSAPVPPRMPALMVKFVTVVAAAPFKFNVPLAILKSVSAKVPVKAVVPEVTFNLPAAGVTMPVEPT